MPERCVLVTVGTTKFDDLIRGVDSVALLETLQRSGYGKLVVQHGSGAYKIRHISPCPLAGFEVQCVLTLPRCKCHHRCSRGAPHPHRTITCTQN